MAADSVEGVASGWYLPACTMFLRWICLGFGVTRTADSRHDDGCTVVLLLHLAFEYNRDCVIVVIYYLCPDVVSKLLGNLLLMHYLYTDLGVKSPSRILDRL